jgi:glucose-6-phosphate-specific signal transduction histidine kinase
MMARRPSDIVQPNLRIQERLRRQLEQAAKKNGVSLNREMVNRLERSFDQEVAQEAAQLINQVATNLEAASARLIAQLQPGANTPLPLAEAAKKTSGDDQ